MINPAEEVVWGLLIVTYPFLTGIVAGSFVVSTLVEVFRKKIYRPVVGLALTVSLAFLLVSAIPLLLDIGRPGRAFNIYFSPNPSSPMAVFGYLLLSLIVLYIVKSLLLFRTGFVERAKSAKGGIGRSFYNALTLGRKSLSEGDRKLTRWLGIIGIPLVILFHGYVGFIFGSVKAREMWATPMMPLAFILSAIVSGIAFVTLLYAFIGKEKNKKEITSSLLGLLGWVLLVDLALVLSELLQVSFLGGEHWALAAQIYNGPLLGTLLIQILFGGIVPLILISMPKIRESMGWAKIISFIVIIGVYAYRWNVVIGGQLLPKMQTTILSYTPTAYEIFSTVFVFVALFVLLGILMRLLPYNMVEDIE